MFRNRQTELRLLEDFWQGSDSQLLVVYGLYLENRTAVDQYIAGCDAEMQRHREAARRGPSVAELRDVWRPAQ